MNGWERVAYFKPEPSFKEEFSFYHTNSFNIVKREVKTLSNSCGIAEINGFNRFEITGEGAHPFLDTLICGRLPRKKGRVGLGYLLNHHGMVKGEATIATLPDGRIWYGSAAAAERHDYDWLMEHIPKDGSVTVKSLTNSHTILLLAGPYARDILTKAAPRGDWSKEAFPWLSVTTSFVGIAHATIIAVSYSGELAYEIHVENSMLYSAYNTLCEVGEAYELGHFGAYAVESMRMEKGYLHWKADLLTEYSPFETGLARFVDMDKPHFIGKEALRNHTPKRQLISLIIERDDAPAQPGDSVLQGDKIVGSVSSAAYGHRVDENLAYAFVDKEAVDGELSVLIMDRLTPAKRVEPCRYDPSNARVKGV